MSYRFSRVFFFNFHLFWCIFFTSSLISTLIYQILIACCLFSMLFSLFLIFFLLLLISRFILEILWSGKMVDIIYFLLSLLKLVLWPTWKECIFCRFLDGLPCRYLLSTTSLMSHLRWLFPYWFSIWMICPLVYVGYKDHLLLLY